MDLNILRDCTERSFVRTHAVLNDASVTVNTEALELWVARILRGNAWLSHLFFKTSLLPQLEEATGKTPWPWDEYSDAQENNPESFQDKTSPVWVLDMTPNVKTHQHRSIIIYQQQHMQGQPHGSSTHNEADPSQEEFSPRLPASQFQQHAPTHQTSVKGSGPATTSQGDRRNGKL